MWSVPMPFDHYIMAETIIFYPFGINIVCILDLQRKRTTVKIAEAL